MKKQKSNIYKEKMPKFKNTPTLPSLLGVITMSQLIVQSIKEDDLDSVIDLLKKKDLLIDSNKCTFCGKGLEKISGFIPNHGKVSPVCDDVECMLKASFAVMKHNGNGSPIIEK